MADVIGSSTIVIDFREEFKHLDVCWQSLVFVCHHILWQWPILRSPADILDVCFFLYWFAHLTSKYSIVDAPTIEGGQSQHSSGSAAKKKPLKAAKYEKLMQHPTMPRLNDRATAVGSAGREDWWLCLYTEERD